MEIINAIFDVFTGITTWLSGAVTSIIPMFWAENSLTFLGSLAVVSLGIGVVFLLIGIVQNFLHFRG